MTLRGGAAVDQLKVVFDVHGPAVHSVALRLVGVSWAADVVQEVFVDLWINPDRYDPERGSLRSLLLRMAHNKSVDIIRREEAREKREERVASGGTTGISDLDGRLIEVEQEGRVHAALGELDAKQREAITLTFFGGVTYKEAALALQIPEGTFKSRIRLGLLELHRMLIDSQVIGPWVMN